MGGLHFAGPNIGINFANLIAGLDIPSGPCLGCPFAPHLKTVVLPATSKLPPTSRRARHCFQHLGRATHFHFHAQPCLTNFSALKPGGIPSFNLSGGKPLSLGPYCFASSVLPSIVLIILICLVLCFSISNVYGTNSKLQLFKG